jgi:hypothetical protein
LTNTSTGGIPAAAPAIACDWIYADRSVAVGNGGGEHVERVSSGLELRSNGCSSEEWVLDFDGEAVVVFAIRVLLLWASNGFRFAAKEVFNELMKLLADRESAGTWNGVPIGVMFGRLRPPAVGLYEQGTNINGLVDMAI